MNISEAAVIELISLARQRGGISIEDLRKTLPIDSMTAEDISHVLARLDEAGFDLEIDPRLLLPESKTAPKEVAPVAKREQTELPETVPEGRRQPTSSPASAGGSSIKNKTTRSREASTSAPMLPWVIAFAIVVIAVFAAFAF